MLEGGARFGACGFRWGRIETRLNDDEAALLSKYGEDEDAYAVQLRNLSSNQLHRDPAFFGCDRSLFLRQLNLESDISTTNFAQRASWRSQLTRSYASIEMSSFILPDLSPPIREFEYHKPIYLYLWQQTGTDLLKELSVHSTNKRNEFFTENFPDGMRIPHTDAWLILRGRLEEIELSLSNIISQRSCAYWYHTYRRLASFLQIAERNEVDDTTTALTRKIADIAIAKYGTLSTSHDFISSIGENYATYMNGLFKEACESTLPNSSYGPAYFTELQNDYPYIISSFTREDFINLLRIDRLSFDYWQTTAHLRTVGKFVDITWHAKSNSIEYHYDVTDKRLFHIHDLTSGDPGGISTLFGTWFDPTEFLDTSRCFAWTNFRPRDSRQGLVICDSEYGPNSIVPISQNYEIGQTNILEFLDANSFANDAFKIRHALDLDSILFALWAASIAAMPYRAINPTLHKQSYLAAKDKQRIEIMRRGYAISTLALPQLADVAIKVASMANYPARIPSLTETMKALEFLTVDDNRDTEMSLWSGGKRPVIIKDHNVNIIDLSAVMSFITRLFFRISDKSGRRGPKFEELFRRSLGDRGYTVAHHGKLKWPDGTERELDASVRIGGKLIIFECVSSERPLDYEIGMPKTVSKRRDIILNKLHQAESLFNKISLSRVGSNFDFGWATSIDWRVVSPHHEFLWADAPPWIDDEGGPRVISPALALRFLTRLSDIGM